jgi:hypothetical protein
MIEFSGQFDPDSVPEQFLEPQSVADSKSDDPIFSSLMLTALQGFVNRTIFKLNGSCFTTAGIRGDLPGRHPPTADSCCCGGASSDYDPARKGSVGVKFRALDHSCSTCSRHRDRVAPCSTFYDAMVLREKMLGLWSIFEEERGEAAACGSRAAVRYNVPVLYSSGMRHG